MLTQLYTSSHIKLLFSRIIFHFWELTQNLLEENYKCLGGGSGNKIFSHMNNSLWTPKPLFTTLTL